MNGIEVRISNSTAKIEMLSFRTSRIILIRRSIVEKKFSFPIPCQMLSHLKFSRRNETICDYSPSLYLTIDVLSLDLPNR